MALQRAGQIASPITDPRVIAGFYATSALGGLALYSGGAFAGGELTTLSLETGGAQSSSALNILNPEVQPKTLQELTRAAQKLFPNKANLVEQHHIFPKYLGGPANGPTAPLNGSYHQVITNAFRQAWGYGQGPPAPGVAQQIMQRIYTFLPIK